MFSMLRILPYQLVSNSFKFLPECRFISKIVKNPTYLLEYEKLCKEVKERTKIGKLILLKKSRFHFNLYI